MTVMPANQTNELVHLWAALYGNVGHLYTPARSERVRPWIPYALDNGRYAQTLKGEAFDDDAYWRYLDSFASRSFRPMWIAVPDVPFNGDETLFWWDRYAFTCREYGIPLALVVQDGMSVADVEERKPDVVFIGGSTEWKWATVGQWCHAFPRVHVGRVNSPDRLYQLHELGAESCDGSGWFRGKAPQVVGLGRFLAWQAGKDEEWAIRCALSTRFGYAEQTVLWADALLETAEVGA